MVFDPFGDFQEKGYLRNVYGEKDIQKVKILENQQYRHALPTILSWLSQQEELTYDCLLETHRRLFGDLYPWAGQDRSETSPNKTVVKGDLVFANPNVIEVAFNAGLRQKTPGRTLGQWAYAHPFLECNGRALFTFFSEYLHRQCKLVLWSEIDSNDLLQAIGSQIEDPKDARLDEVLDAATRYISPSSSLPELVNQLHKINWTQDPTERKSKP